MITAQVEPYSKCLPELMECYDLHWEELALNKDKVPLDPQYDLYEARDDAGQLLLVTLRETGRLVGYFIGFIAPGFHYKTCLTLTMDIFWTHPDVRGGFSGVKLFRLVEKEAKRRGVHRMFYGSKMHKDASRLFQFLKMDPVEMYYTKWIGD
jgi:GNAT superfamily N-acetyltransferase